MGSIHTHRPGLNASTISETVTAFEGKLGEEKAPKDRLN
jgi:hypothetical protein